MERPQDDEYERLLEELDHAGEILLAQNLQKGEDILVKVQGDWGGAFVVTNRRIYVIKHGLWSGRMTGGQCTGFPLEQVASINLNTAMLVGAVEVLAAGTLVGRGSVSWTGANKKAREAENVVLFRVGGGRSAVFQRAVSIAQNAVFSVAERRVNEKKDRSSANEIQQLASLRDKGILTEEEFQAKKKQLLGL